MAPEKEIAGKKLDAWIDEEKKSFKVKIITGKRYEYRIIAYLDILGTKKLIEKHQVDEYKAIQRIERIRTIVESSLESLMYKNIIDFNYISDSIVLVCKPEALKALIVALANIQMRIVCECHFLLRGAITIGKVISKDKAKFIIGPAFIEAFLLQEKDAIYPRIIISNSLMVEINKYPDIKNYIKIDQDKEYFIDYIHLFMKNEGRFKNNLKAKLQSDDVFNYLEKEYEDNNNDMNHRTKQKYGWTIQYYKRLEVWKNEN